ncbi:MAG: glutamate dehydrogenase [Aequorivita sp.]|nr:glutamate dehydrogenase [Aequorivita sp.]
MNTRILLLVFFLLVFAKQEVYSQFGFSHEVGLITGPVVFYSDFGQRNNFETNGRNTGFGVGLIHYINFSYRADCNCYTRDKYFNDHFKIRNEIDYHKTNLKHYGRWVAPDQTSLFADQLRAMSGSTSVFEIGSQLEYFPLSIRDFAAGSFKIAPFMSFGVHYVSYTSEVTSTMGPLNSPISTPDKYYNSFQQGSASTWAMVGSVGIRYKLTPLSDLMLDSRWEYYFTDYLDGLNPSLKNNGTTPVPENKANEWIYWLNIGYIYYID